MPKGKQIHHKGRNRRFTNPEELEEQRKQEEKKKNWRKRNNIPSSDEESDKESNDEPKGSDESSEESDEETRKAKGVEGLIAIENPNRLQSKMKKLSAINDETAADDKPTLTRREREELQKQRAAQHYQKLHAEGKTEEARADLARLAIIRQQREEAAKKREDEKKEKELAKQTKTSSSLKAIKKR